MRGQGIQGIKESGIRESGDHGMRYQKRGDDLRGTGNQESGNRLPFYTFHTQSPDPLIPDSLIAMTDTGGYKR
jgi:hypothetical protein